MSRRNETANLLAVLGDDDLFTQFGKVKQFIKMIFRLFDGHRFQQNLHRHAGKGGYPSSP